MDTELRKFGFVLSGGILGLFGLLPLIIHHQYALWPVPICCALVFISIVKPAYLKNFYQLWMKVGHVLGFINTRIILGLLFFVIITPIGLIRRALKKPGLALSYDKTVDSYKLSSQKLDPNHMEKPF